MKSILYITISFFFIANLKGQTNNSKKVNTFFNSASDIHIIKSENEKYFLKTLSYDNLRNTSVGNTIIYSSDSTELYTINRYFYIRKNESEILISNDGTKVAYISDKVLGLKDGNENIIVFNNGEKTTSFNLSELTDCDSESLDCYLFYRRKYEVWANNEHVNINDTTHLENKLMESVLYTDNDTVYIFSKLGRLIKLNLNTSEINFESYREIDISIFDRLKSVKINTLKLKNVPSFLNLPKLKDGNSFYESLAKYLNLQVTPETLKYKNEYKKYWINFDLIIDKTGIANIDSIINYTYNFPVSKLTEFVKTCSFNSSTVPEEVGKWKYTVSISLMNTNLKISKKERLIEIKQENIIRQKNYVADSINGIYIPKNIEECFYQLNKILEPRFVEKIKNLNNSSETIRFHFGLGMWIRNNWGLWGGSRLQLYMQKRGIEHPDSMSGVILSYYYDWLNGNNDNWQKFDKMKSKSNILWL
ncbi:DUF6794 domain-containing protein [Saccharicrinis sp. FJH62]|uniref:DUF6794 domain-containing protein n=1 Tax=Saccharicrinis sp. FJH62 TaxID=3344657 RepID=UPI0035D4089F